MKPSDTTSVLEAIPAIPRNNEGPIFREPWEAEVFATTLSLYEQGLFTWPAWATCLSEEIVRAQENGDPDLGDTYYQHWLAALEKMIVKIELGNETQLHQLYSAWDCAAQSTPHGRPITLTQSTIDACVKGKDRPL